jgi:hypothetical protein
MIFISDYSLRSKDILQFCYFSYREPRGTHVYVHPPSHNKKNFRKNFHKKNFKKSKKILEKFYFQNLTFFKFGFIK